jgi:hypothetical protein
MDGHQVRRVAVARAALRPGEVECPDGLQDHIMLRPPSGFSSALRSPPNMDIPPITQPQTGQLGRQNSRNPWVVGS